MTMKEFTAKLLSVKCPQCGASKGVTCSDSMGLWKLHYGHSTRRFATNVTIKGVK